MESFNAKKSQANSTKHAKVYTTPLYVLIFVDARWIDTGLRNTDQSGVRQQQQRQRLYSRISAVAFLFPLSLFPASSVYERSLITAKPHPLKQVECATLLQAPLPRGQLFQRQPVRCTERRQRRSSPLSVKHSNPVSADYSARSFRVQYSMSRHETWLLVVVTRSCECFFYSFRVWNW